MMKFVQYKNWLARKIAEDGCCQSEAVSFLWADPDKEDVLDYFASYFDLDTVRMRDVKAAAAEIYQKNQATIASAFPEVIRVWRCGDLAGGITSVTTDEQVAIRGCQGGYYKGAAVKSYLVDRADVLVSVKHFWPWSDFDESELLVRSNSLRSLNESVLRRYIRELLTEQTNEPKRMPLDIPIPEDLKAIHQRMKRAGMQLFLVGGAVRDALMNKVPKDYDVATNATPEAVIELLQQDPELKIDLTGKAFGVVRVKTPAGEEYEIATFRKDIGKGRRPDAVEFTTIEDDVKRRDLTINALFYNMDTGEVVDYVGGIDDIKNGVIKAVGDPATRFDEDKLRILRTVRFAGRTGSDLDPATRDAILADNDLSEISAERITDEFVKGIHSSKNPAYFLSMMEDLGLFSQVLPGLRVQTKESGSKDPVVQIAALIAENPPDLVEKQLNKMKHTAFNVDTIKFLIGLPSLDKESAVKLKKEFNRLRIDPSRILEFANLTGKISVKRAKAFIDFAQSPPATNPKDLMAKGLKGPDIGKAMASAEADAYAQHVNEARKYVRELLKELNLGIGTGIDYTGFVLSPETSNALKKYVPKGWVEKSHHMTIISPPHQKRRLPSHWLDFEDKKSGQMRVVGIAQNEQVVTGLVDLGGLPIPMKGPSFPHVTIAINPKTGGKAEMSNEFQLSDFERIDPIPLFGTVEEVMK